MGFDGVIVYVDQGGKTPQFYVGGYKNTENKISADPNALFKIASVSKLYIALSIAKLERSERISINKTLAYYMPELEERIDNADEITLKMLVQHRSGIPNFTNIPSFWSNPPSSSQKALELIFDMPANFDPDGDYEYCNTNYLLLSMIIDKVLGYNHFQFVEEEILKPLNLKNTYGSINDVNLEDVMSGYYVGHKGDLKKDDNSMLATAEDLGQFIRALNDGSVFTDQKEQDIYSSIYVYGHTGLIPGYQTIAKYHADIDAVIIQFTNTVNFEGYNWNLSEVGYDRILKILRRNKK